MTYGTGINRPKYNPRSATATTRKARARRLAALKNFTVGATVRWKYGQDDLTVTGHDMDNGRVLTTSNGSYHPDELELIKVK